MSMDPLITRNGQRVKVTTKNPVYDMSTEYTRPSVSGNPCLPNQGSDRTRARVEGSKNPRTGPGYHRKRTLQIKTYNVRTLSTTYKLQELNKELKFLRWDILGISEHKRKEEKELILQSGHLPYYVGTDNINQGGVGFLIHAMSYRSKA